MLFLETVCELVVVVLVICTTVSGHGKNGCQCPLQQHVSQTYVSFWVNHSVRHTCPADLCTLDHPVAEQPSLVAACGLSSLTARMYPLYSFLQWAGSLTLAQQTHDV